jgi:arginine/lysine/ornithine decarboxylase
MIDSKQEKQVKEKLSAFVHDTYILLEKVAYEKIELEGQLFLRTLPAKIRDAWKLPAKIRDAWKEFKANCPLKEVLQSISNTPAKELESHGLYGNQLKLKLAIIDVLKKRLTSFRTKKILIELLEALDIILDGLIPAARIDGALKNIKDSMKSSIDS